MFSDNDCPLRCGGVDTIENILTCPVLQNNLHSEELTNNIYSSDIHAQKQVTELYTKLMSIRENIINKLCCASVKLLVWLEFSKAISYFIRTCSRCSQEATFKVSLKSGQ